MTPQDNESKNLFQLRIYEVSGERRQAFHSRFQNHALRIMARYGFEMVSCWESTSLIDFEFIYILKWPNIETMERQWKLFYADSEWIEIKRKMAEEIGEPVQRVTSRVLAPVEQFSAVASPRLNTKPGATRVECIRTRGSRRTKL